MSRRGQPPLVHCYDSTGVCGDRVVGRKAWLGFVRSSTIRLSILGRTPKTRPILPLFWLRFGMRAPWSMIPAHP